MHLQTSHTTTELVHIPVNSIVLDGELTVPPDATMLVIFAHGSGSSRLSPRNQYVARELEKNGLATLLVDLLTKTEDETYTTRFDIDLLTERLVIITDWAARDERTEHLDVGYFGASTGAAAAIQAAIGAEGVVRAIVSRGGRVDLAADDLPDLRVPTLLIVGKLDEGVLELNRDALRSMACEKRLEIVPGATHLFEEPGALEEVSELAADWFSEHAPNTEHYAM